jgi:hypothetical protein
LIGRAAPALDADFRARFADGSVLLVLDGPVENDDHIWWKVQGVIGTGWSVAAFLAPRDQ